MFSDAFVMLCPTAHVTGTVHIIAGGAHILRALRSPAAEGDRHRLHLGWASTESRHQRARSRPRLLLLRISDL
jgi:hypothetical protein